MSSLPLFTVSSSCSLKYDRTTKGVLLILFVWLCGGLHLVLPNHGGSGLALPQNIMAWSVMALIALWCAGSLPLRSAAGRATFELPPGTAMIITGVILWSLPLLWSPRTDWQLDALPRVSGLWALAGSYMVLLFTTPCRDIRTPLLALLIAGAVLQAAHAGVQLAAIATLPGGRPYGSFQQVNVLASFLATGMACALWLFLQPVRRRNSALSALALFVLPAMLALLQSRAGSLGALLAAALILPIARKRQASIALAIVAAGAGMGLLWLYAGSYLLPGFVPPVIDKASSTHSRLYMLKLTWQLIMQHPVVGNGYGGFEALFGQLAQSIPPGLEAATVKYPHNELLFAWVEGGICAVVGMMLMIAGVLTRLLSREGAGLCGIGLLLPLAVHINLEYPLYQSTIHSLTLIVLLAISGPGVKRLPMYKRVAVQRRNLTGTAWRWLTVVIAAGSVIFMITALQTQQQLTLVEQQGLQPLADDERQVLASLANPWSQSSRLDFDRHVALLLRFNHTRDLAQLAAFRRWGLRYIQTHNDPAVYASLLTIARAQQLPEAARLCEEAHGRWLRDPRFVCG